MRTRWHRYVVILAIGALALNCVGFQGAMAAHHPDSSAVERTIDHRSHDHTAAVHDHHDSAGTDSGIAHTDKPSGVDEPSKVCCTSMNCSATAILTPGDVVQFRAVKNPVAIVFDDAERTVAIGIIDPPPRSI